MDPQILTTFSILVVATAAFYFGSRAVRTGVESEKKAAKADAPLASQTDINYYATGLFQAKLSFAVSLVAAGLGFVFILFSTALVLSNSSTGTAQVVVPLLAGTVTEAVAALFFVQSNKAREAMIALLDKFREDARRQDAIELLGRVKDEAIQARLRAAIALSYAGVSGELLNAVLDAAVGQGGPVGTDALPSKGTRKSATTGRAQHKLERPAAEDAEVSRS
jgi:TRADD-N domain-containing protein